VNLTEGNKALLKKLQARARAHPLATVSAPVAARCSKSSGPRPIRSIRGVQATGEFISTVFQGCSGMDALTGTYRVQQAAGPRPFKTVGNTICTGAAVHTGKDTPRYTPQTHDGRPCRRSWAGISHHHGQPGLGVDPLGLSHLLRAKQVHHFVSLPSCIHSGCCYA
jgi:hypothetical protein